MYGWSAEQAIGRPETFFRLDESDEQHMERRRQPLSMAAGAERSLCSARTERRFPSSRSASRSATSRVR
jgi:predicted ArsR family transcriptional regulator